MIDEDFIKGLHKKKKYKTNHQPYIRDEPKYIGLSLKPCYTTK